MSIVGIVDFNGVVIAANSHGRITLWDLAGRLSSHFVLSDQPSFIQSTGQLLIQVPLKGLHLSEQKLIAFGKNDIFVLEAAKVSQISTNIVNYPASNFILNHLELSTLLGATQQLNCLAVVDNQTIVFGSDKGNLHLYNFQEEALKSVSVSHTGEESQTFTQQNIQVRAVQTYREGTLAVVSLSCGRTYIWNLLHGKAVADLKLSEDNPGEPVQGITIAEDHVYLLHKNYVTQWSLKFNTCLCYIKVSNPTALLVQAGVLWLAAPCKGISVWVDQQLRLVESSLRSVTVLHAKEGWTMAGGTNNMIEVMAESMRVITLIN